MNRHQFITLKLQEAREARINAMLNAGGPNNERIFHAYIAQAHRRLSYAHALNQIAREGRAGVLAFPEKLAA